MTCRKKEKPRVRIVKGLFLVFTSKQKSRDGIEYSSCMSMTEALSVAAIMRQK